MNNNLNLNNNPTLFFLQVTDRSVRAVAENCPELQFVGFMGCPVTSQGVIHLTAVSHLTIFNFRNDDFFFLAWLPGLNSICVLSHDKKTQSAFVPTAQSKG